jgi:hypothetical protein
VLVKKVARRIAARHGVGLTPLTSCGQEGANTAVEQRPLVEKQVANAVNCNDPGLGLGASRRASA